MLKFDYFGVLHYSENKNTNWQEPKQFEVNLSYELGDLVTVTVMLFQSCVLNKV